MSCPILVTGATGFIGRRLVNRLTAQGAEVRCLVRREVSIPGATVVRGDLARGDGLAQAAAGVELVLHLAGTTKALRRRDYFEGNTRATRNLLSACSPRTKLVHISSLAAAGPSLDGRPLVEQVSPHPVSAYGRSKFEAEQAVRTSPLSGRAVILRPAVVYGPGDTDVFQVFRSVRQGLFFTVGRGESRFSYIYVDDLVEAILMAAESRSAEGNTYFISNPAPVAWSDFAALAGRLLSTRFTTLRVPQSPAYVAAFMAEIAARLRAKPGIFSRDKVREAIHACWTCDPSLARRDFRFQADTSLEDGMAVTLCWYKEAGWLKP